MLLFCSDFVDWHFSFWESNLECIRNEILKKWIEIPEDMTIYSKEYNKIIDWKIYKIIENIKFNWEKTIETIEEKSEKS